MRVCRDGCMFIDIDRSSLAKMDVRRETCVFVDEHACSATSMGYQSGMKGLRNILCGVTGKDHTSWIVSPRYDLAWFFGGALISAVVLGLYFGAGVPIVLLFWIWLLAFDGPHIGAAFTRTYLDRRE